MQKQGLILNKDFPRVILGYLLFTRANINIILIHFPSLGYFELAVKLNFHLKMIIFALKSKEKKINNENIKTKSEKKFYNCILTTISFFLACVFIFAIQFFFYLEANDDINKR